MDTPVEIHLYGQLRKYAPDPRADRENVIRVTLNAGETVRLSGLTGRVTVEASYR